MSGGIPYVISLKAVSSASSFSRSSAVGGKVPSSAPRACSAGVAILAVVVRTCAENLMMGQPIINFVNQWVDPIVQLLNNCNPVPKMLIVLQVQEHWVPKVHETPDFIFSESRSNLEGKYYIDSSKTNRNGLHEQARDILPPHLQFLPPTFHEQNGIPPTMVSFVMQQRRRQRKKEKKREEANHRRRLRALAERRTTTKTCSTESKLPAIKQVTGTLGRACRNEPQEAKENQSIDLIDSCLKYSSQEREVPGIDKAKQNTKSRVLQNWRFEFCKIEIGDFFFRIAGLIHEFDRSRSSESRPCRRTIFNFGSEEGRSR
ncbi:hypothetical protein LXL04_029130 [Taraxacum kok-saghyz]